MTHPLDKPLGPQAQHECHWSHYDGERMMFDIMCVLPLPPKDAEYLLKTMEFAMRIIARSSGLGVEGEGL